MCVGFIPTVKSESKYLALKVPFEPLHCTGESFIGEIFGRREAG